MADTKRARYDLTQGGILSKLLMVAVPIMGTQLMQMAYNLTDMFWLGRVGSEAVAASGTAGMYLWLSQAPLFLGRTGAEIGAAQSLGRGDEGEARRYSQNALMLGAVLGVLFAAVMILFARPLIGFFGIREAEVALSAQRYLLITSLGIPATYVTAAAAGTFNGSGNSRAPFFINAVGLLFNMVLDPVLIFSAGMGIDGAAWATTTAQILVGLLSLAALRFRHIRPFDGYRFVSRPDRAILRQILRWSIPVAAESFFFTVLSMIIARFVAAFGADAIAVQRVGTQIESLSWLICGGFATAITAFIGQNYGAGKWGRIHSGFRISLITITIWGAVVTVVLFLAGGQLFRIFLSEPRLVAMGTTYLRILSLCMVVMSLEAAAAGAFRGLGKTLPPSAVSITFNALRVPLVYVFSRSSLGLDGIWVGITLGASLRGLGIFIWFVLHLRTQPVDDPDPEA